MKNGWPTLYNMRLDPFERMGMGPGESTMNMQNYYGQEFWRFVMMQEAVAKLAKTAIDYPPLQKGASFNLDAVKQQIKEAQGASGQ